MMRPVILLYIAITLLFASPFLSHAANGSIPEETYVVRKGDTLWSIAAEKMSDPSQWQELWKINAFIGNPDRIYPGESIQIPGVHSQAPVQAATAIASASEVPLPGEIVSVEEINPLRVETAKRQLLEKDLILRGGYVTEELKPEGKIIGAPSGRTVYSEGDYVYITSPYDVKKFYIVEADRKIKKSHNGGKRGRLLNFLGIAKVIGEEAGYKKAIITEFFNDIPVNSALIRYYDFEPPVDTNSKIEQKAGGTIIDKADSHVLNSMFSILYTDKGREHGIKPGSIYTIYSGVEPKRPIGKLKIISVQKDTSTAYILNNETEIREGDRF